jgi:mediator of RNA polymerase II transcription subunit 21
MYASINYIKSRHPYGDISGQPSQAPAPLSISAPNSAAPQSAVSHSQANGGASQQLTNGQATNADPAPERTGSPPPEHPDVFNAALHELARDLVLQEQQIEVLVNSLPGLGNSEASQERRMIELEHELREAEAGRAKAELDREKMMEVLGQWLEGVRRVP